MRRELGVGTGGLVALLVGFFVHVLGWRCFSKDFHRELQKMENHIHSYEIQFSSHSNSHRNLWREGRIKLPSVI